MKKAEIKFQNIAIGIIYFSSYTIEEVLNWKVYRFLDKEGKMISNIILDPYETKEGLEVEICE